jgi:hypothetical protein
MAGPAMSASGKSGAVMTVGETRISASTRMLASNTAAVDGIGAEAGTVIG